MFQFKNITIEYENKKVVEGFSFDIEKKENLLYSWRKWEW